MLKAQVNVKTYYVDHIKCFTEFNGLDMLFFKVTLKKSKL